MAWYPIDQSLYNDNPKVMHLTEELDSEEAHVIGHLTSLWSWALDHAPDGRLPESNRAIAKGAKWNGSADAFVNSLITTHWIDMTEEGRVLHDWFDWAGKNVQARCKKREEMRERRYSTVPPQYLHSGSTSTSTVEPKERKRESKDIPPKSHKGDRKRVSRYEYSPEFEGFWKVYPRRDDKAIAVKAFNGAIGRLQEKGRGWETLIKAAENYATHCQQRGTTEDMVKLPATFCNKDIEEIIRMAEWVAQPSQPIATRATCSSPEMQAAMDREDAERRAALEAAHA
jgi:hypothetical protein